MEIALFIIILSGMVLIDLKLWAILRELRKQSKLLSAQLSDCKHTGD